MKIDGYNLWPHKAGLREFVMLTGVQCREMRDTRAPRRCSFCGNATRLHSCIDRRSMRTALVNDYRVGGRP